MPRLNRRRVRGRKLGRPAPQGPLPAPPPEGNPANSASTEFVLPSVGAKLPAPRSGSSQDSTIEVLDLPRDSDPNDETAEAVSVEINPPGRLEFTCSCGTRLVATTETYDKHTRCAMCQTVMLLNLVYDPERNSHEIVPFRVNPDSGP